MSTLSLRFNFSVVVVASFEFSEPSVSSCSGDSSLGLLSVHGSNLDSSSPGKQMTTRYQWALKIRTWKNYFDFYCNITTILEQWQRKILKNHFIKTTLYYDFFSLTAILFLSFMNFLSHVCARMLTYSWLTGTNRKSFLKMSTWRVHVFTLWCRFCLWQLNIKKPKWINSSRSRSFFLLRWRLTIPWHCLRWRCLCEWAAYRRSCWKCASARQHPAASSGGGIWVESPRVNSKWAKRTKWRCWIIVVVTLTWGKSRWWRHWGTGRCRDTAGLPLSPWFHLWVEAEETGST